MLAVADTVAFLDAGNLAFVAPATEVDEERLVQAYLGLRLQPRPACRDGAGAGLTVEERTPRSSPERTAAFWTGGADGVLRIARCADVRPLAAPAAAGVPGAAAAATSRPRPCRGGARVWSFTVNRYPWSPAMRAALRASPRSSSTSSPGCGCSPRSSTASRRPRSACRSTVCFEPAGDSVDPAVRRREGRESSGACISRHRLVATSVAGCTAIRWLLTADAALAAIADAGLDRRRHRRRVDVPGRRLVDAGHHRRRRRRRAGDARAAPALAHRRRRAAGPARFARQRRDGRRRGPRRPRAVLPHRVGVDRPGSRPAAARRVVASAALATTVQWGGPTASATRRYGALAMQRYMRAAARPASSSPRSPSSPGQRRRQPRRRVPRSADPRRLPRRRA